MSTVSESIPTPDQAQAGDTAAGVYDPNDPQGPPPQRRAMIAAAIFIGYFVVILLVAKFAPGTVGVIARGMLRESLSAQTAAVAIAIIGLNVHFGYTGLLNMGQSGFMLLGAYGFSISIWKGLPMPVGILVGFLAAFVFALILGVPTLKLRGDYLAIVTISAAEILRYVGRLAKLENFTGAAQGIPGSQYRDPFVNLSFFGDGTFDAGGWLPNLQSTGVNGWWVRFVAWLLVALCCVIVFLLARSPWGRLLRGIREDEDAIRSLGKNVFAIKMQALVIGGLFGALGGMVYILPSSMQPDAMGRNLTFFCWTALLLGGAATVFGPVIGAILFFALRVFIQGTAGAIVPDSIMNLSQTAQFAWICVGITLMLLVIFRPQGILGDKRELRFNV
ncbi:branched-chain amino acid ABC transporter permease [Nocardioides islandensis]|jgi:branched-chain amino acid transport system permease protein|nr:branched-chain amino acid ABC transporter permease [Nocardioides islandensis]